MLTRICLIVLSVSLASCGLFDNMDKMKSTTDSLASKTDSLLQESQNLAYMTRMLYRSNRQGSSQEIRSNRLRDLVGENYSIEIKFRHAAVYFRAFEFQVFDDRIDAVDGQADNRYRDVLLASAAEEFMITLRGLLGGPFPEIDPLSDDSALQTLFALATTVDQINDLQVEAGQKYKFTPVSVLDLIVNAIRLRKQAEADPRSVPAYVYKVLVDYPLAMYLLDLRYNIYSTLVLDGLYNVSQMSMTEKIRMLLRSSIDVNLSHMNTSKLTEINTRYLAYALATKKYIVEAERVPGMNDSLLKLLKKAKFKDDPNASPTKLRLIEQLKANHAKLVCESCP